MKAITVVKAVRVIRGKYVYGNRYTVVGKVCIALLRLSLNSSPPILVHKKSKKVIYRKQIARQHSCTKTFGQGRECSRSCENFPHV